MLYTSNIDINLSFIDKLLNIDIVAAFYKIDCIFANNNNLVFINTRNRDFFFLNL